MAPDLIYHDLLTVSYVDSRRAGIYWLRLFRDGDRYVAVITEVPGNPSFSVTNAISEITIHIMQEFEIRPDRLSAYQIHPRRTDYGETNVKRVSVGRYPSWEGSSRAEIEADLGIPLPELPAHEELYRQVLQRGGGTYRNIYRAIFEAVDPTELPPFYNLFKCKHFERFKAVKADAEKESRHYDWGRIGRAFTDTITADDTGSCYYHNADWKAIADESVRIITELGQREANAYEIAAGKSPLPPGDRNWLTSLFNDPIDIAGSGYTDGQHRACALRFSGATAAAVVVRNERGRNVRTGITRVTASCPTEVACARRRAASGPLSGPVLETLQGGCAVKAAPEGAAARTTCRLQFGLQSSCVQHCLHPSTLSCDLHL